MIDRPARDKSCRLLRDLVARNIDGAYFEDAVDLLKSDDGVVSATYTAGWVLYSEGKSVSKTTSRFARSHIARLVLFLQTDLPYDWPIYPLGERPIFNWPMNILTFGRWETKKQSLSEEWMGHGDFLVWPFHNRRDFNVIKRKPRLLVG